ncbi:hypothetical protein BUE93_07735 [Chromobacterium amazonense]|uniref:Uncharacterized protein n=1 Tax=Chromobacterium amazonense TaxID=1382803 RepID=A0A2S9X690_9NEIS|nr:hypothetical protein BUE93_07735 [Chromobacterium amazonense]
MRRVAVHTLLISLAIVCITWVTIVVVEALSDAEDRTSLILACLMVPAVLLLLYGAGELAYVML